MLWIRKLKTLNMVLIRLPVGFSEEIIAVFQMKKSQIDTENDKNPKIFHFSKFLRIFRRILDRLRGLECFKGSTRKERVGFPVVVSEEFSAFLKLKCPKLTPKMTKFI